MIEGDEHEDGSLADYTFKEVAELARGELPVKGQRPSDAGTFAQIRDEIGNFGAATVGDLHKFTVTTYEVMLRIQTPEEGLER